MTEEPYEDLETPEETPSSVSFQDLSVREMLNIPVLDLVWLLGSAVAERKPFRPMTQWLRSHPRRISNRAYRLGALGLFLLVYVVYFLLTGVWNPLSMLESVPFFAYTDFIEATGSEAAYTGYVCWCVGLSTLVLGLVRRFVLDNRSVRRFSRDGICFWLMCVWLSALVGQLLYPVAVWYSGNSSAGAPLGSNVLTALLYVCTAISLACCFEDAVSGLLEIYVSLGMLRLMLRLHIVDGAVWLITHLYYLTPNAPWEQFDMVFFLNMILYLMGAAIMGLLDYSGLLRMLLGKLRKLLTIRNLIILPFVVLVVLGIYLLLR